MPVNLDIESDTITKIRGPHSHENKLLASLVSTKVSEARNKSLVGGSLEAQSGVQSVDGQPSS